MVEQAGFVEENLYWMFPIVWNLSIPLPCLKFTGFAGFTGLPLPWLKFTGFTGFASEANRTTCTPVDAEEGMLEWDGSLGAIITFKKSS